MRTRGTARIPAVVLVLAEAALLAGAASEFYQIAWGTGTGIGQFSIKWAIVFGCFVLLCIAILAGTVLIVWPRPGAARVEALALGPRFPDALRWTITAVAIIVPIWFLQYTAWGVVLNGAYLRLLIWLLMSAVAGYLLMAGDGSWRFWQGFLVGALLSGTGFGVAAALGGVTSYPFSLGWSEGNRLWDYSLLFGKGLYSYAGGQVPAAYLDIGRQLVGGLPFLLPPVSIVGERLWLAAMNVVPYVLLGLAAFWPIRRSGWGDVLLLSLWTFMFLSQGPIHTPLLLCAVLVAISWRLPLWPSALLVMASGYFADVSRFTWMFAPAIWAAMLQVAGAHGDESRFLGPAWRRATILGLAGLVGAGAGMVPGMAPGATSVGTTTAASTSQALLWYRLFPNATYGAGILLGIALAAAPLVVLLVILQARLWNLTALQKWSIVLPLAAFLTVGLIVSTKIGGGGDLHNLDMFLIGLVFAAALAWKAIGADGLSSWVRGSLWAEVLMLALVSVPAFQPLMALRPLSFSQDTAWVAVLADVERARDLGSLPDAQVVSSSLDQLVAAVRDAQAHGEVLFMDQRQLLTFGDIRNVPLVGAYEKKRLMDEALSQDQAYFQPFYADLAAHRFALIISSPLRTPIKDSEYGFGEENNAWVKWVARPILCYYAEQDTLNEVKVELLTPRSTSEACALP
jgi:hypothetical protein